MTASSGTPSGNLIILDRSMPFEQRATMAVDQWSASGKHPDGLVNGLAFFLLYCWFFEHGDDRGSEPDRKHGEERSPLGDSPKMRDFVEASLAAIGGEDGWNAMLNKREYCRCGSTNRLENMSICVECTTYQCWECVRNPKGHAKTSGHEVVG